MTHEIVERSALAEARLGRAAPQGDPDRELVLRWRAGDPAAFEVLVRRHEQRVFRLLLRMLGTREEAEDVAQETFLSLHRHGRRFRGDARFSTFVYRVAVNAALNRRRSLGRQQARNEAAARDHAVREGGASGLRSPEDALAGAQLQAQVHGALLALPVTLRSPVVLYDLEGLSYGEIAEVLGLAEGTVKSRIHRARQALRERLRRFLPGPEHGGAA